MATRHDVDDDPAVLHPLHGLVAGVDGQLLPDRLLDRDLAAFSYSTAHGRDATPHSYRGVKRSLGILRPVAAIDLNGIRLRNRLLTSASLLGYGASKSRLILYGLSPIAQWVPLERFGAVTTRTVTLQPREGHFTLKEDWGLREFPEMLRLYGRALHRVDARLAQRLRLVEHRHRALLRRVLRPRPRTSTGS